MYTIEPVTTKKQLKQFVQFQLDLYKGCEFFVPPFFSDEMSHLDPAKSAYMVDGAAEAQCFICRDESGKIVGRICGILSHDYNKKNNEKRIRISRFDCIDDEDVAKLLFDTVEEWGRQKGMEAVHGPLGFNDMEREGLLIEGFDTISTVNTQYYYPYFEKFFDKFGYQKEIDWLEYRFWRTSDCDDRTGRLSEAVSKRLGIHELEIKSIPWLIKNYYDEIFDLLDEAYGSLYGTVPITPVVRQSVIGQFKMVLKKDLISILVDNDGKIVAVGLLMPNLSESIRDCGGKLFPFGWVKVLRELNHPKALEMLLIGVKKEYRDRGVTSIIFHHILERIAKHYSDMEYAETNLQLEDNYKVQQLFTKAFETKEVRRRRCYCKSLNGQPVKLHSCLEEIPSKTVDESSEEPNVGE